MRGYAVWQICGEAWKSSKMPLPTSLIARQTQIPAPVFPVPGPSMMTA